MEQHLAELQQVLNTVLQNDNVQRKNAENQLNTLKKNDPANYAQVMINVLHPQNQTTHEIRSIAAVILRRNISTTDIDVGDASDSANNQNLWERLSDPTRDAVKTALIFVL